jgi:HrpA-like RNA helicase
LALPLLLLLLLQVDFLLTAMRQLTAVRPDLKLLLMSATVDTNKLADYFNGTAQGGC